MVDLQQLGSMIRAARERKGWTIYDLAPKVGVSAQYISSLERGKGNPTLEVLHNLAAAVELDVELVVKEVPTNAAVDRMARVLRGLDENAILHLTWIAQGWMQAPEPFRQGTAAAFRSLAETTEPSQSVVPQASRGGL